MKEVLLKNIKDKKAVIGIIGLGYVGLPLALRFCEVGFKVLGFDIDVKKVTQINHGKSYIKHINQDRIFSAWNSGNLKATNKFAEIKNTDIIILCVPTPLGVHNEPDLSFITNTLDQITPYLREGQVISLESSTYPGTTDEVILPLIEKQGFKPGQDFFVIYSPEREDPGNKTYDVQSIPKIVGGITESCLEVGRYIYSSIVDIVVPVSSTRVAELAKLVENIYRSINIGLVNELKIIADKMDINIRDVIDAAATKPFGFTPFYPGPGLGGHCIPIDPFYLTWKAKEYGIHTRFIELAGEINTSMPDWVIQKVLQGLNQQKKSLRGAKVLILGLSYKKNIDDLRESPALKIIEILEDWGAIVSYSDPYIPVLSQTRKYNFDKCSIEISKEVLMNQDCVLLITDHDVFDYATILENSKLIVDTRGRYREPSPKVVNA